jgi:hypothetical protein
MLTGEEVHDQARDPQKNHLLVYEAHKELAPLAPEPQRLLDGVRQEGALSFLAHPYDPAAPLFHEADLSWVSEEVTGFTGIELWNFMSEFKARLTSLPSAVLHAFFPQRSAEGPFLEVLARWDRLLEAGEQIVAIGNSDAHAIPYRMGPIRRVIFPYRFLFGAVNTHILTDQPLSGEVDRDRRRLFYNLARGHCFVANNLPASARGFRFSAQSDRGEAMMGDSLDTRFGVTFQIRTPQLAVIRLIRHGILIKEWEARETVVHNASEPGAYRVEAHLPFQGKLRGWIYSNPIYVR